MPRVRKKLPRNATEIISDLASRGVKEVDIAKALGMSFPVWKRLRESDERARIAYESAKAIEHDKLFSVIFDKATGGDVVACMFLLKCRHGYRENAEVPLGTGVVINLPSPLSPAEYSKLVNVNNVNSKHLPVNNHGE